MKKKPTKPSVGNIARLAGVSTPAASFALNNQPGVSPETRKKILRIAKKLGYSPDARVGSWMAQVRDAKSKSPLPIAWLNTGWQKDAWHRYSFQAPYLEGAQERALELGYKVEEIWCHEPGMTMKRLSNILYQRGIEGVIVTHPARHMRINWDHLASVALGNSLLAPQLHRVTADFTHNFQLALKSLKRLGFRRIGVCLTQEIDNYSNHGIGAAARDHYFGVASSDRVPLFFYGPFFYDKLASYDDEKKAETIAWIKRHRPQVIIGYDGRLKEWAEEAGLRVPKDISIVHLALDDDVLTWGGIHSHRRETGATAVEWVVSLMRNRQFGVPKAPLNILIQGTWQSGVTLEPPTKTKTGRPISIMKEA
jgi:LacI family transcriptional regulator